MLPNSVIFWSSERESNGYVGVFFESTGDHVSYTRGSKTSGNMKNFEIGVKIIVCF